MIETIYSYVPYEIVKLIRQSEAELASIRDWEDSSDGFRIYSLRLQDGNAINALEVDFVATGLFEAPFRYYELVIINTENPESKSLNGQKGMIRGISVDDINHRWYFAVEIKEDNCYMFEESDLVKTNIILTREDSYQW